MGEKLPVILAGCCKVRLTCHKEWDETADL